MCKTELTVEMFLRSVILRKCAVGQKVHTTFIRMFLVQTLKKHSYPGKASSCLTSANCFDSSQLLVIGQSRRLGCYQIIVKMQGDKTFPKRSQKHKREKPQLCTQCNKLFSAAGDLRKHSKSHTGETYVCSQCNEASLYAATLKNHMRNHTGEKPYLCKQCEKSFRDAGGLKSHMKVHSEKKTRVYTMQQKSQI